ncbi:MAG: hypothetical protein VX837_02795, partial [Candidatus Thermoplasmatota archaeon]|nr:hypothetical protein [Candidatus Thermoplasmatota archaeon]
MSVIVIGEVDGSTIKPASQQAAALATQLGDPLGLVFGSTDAAGKLATPRIISVPGVEHYDSLQFATIAAQVARDSGATSVVMAATAMGKDLGPRLAAELGQTVASTPATATPTAFSNPVQFRVGTNATGQDETSLRAAVSR